MGLPYCQAEMYAGHVACCSLVSNGEYADETNRQMDGQTDAASVIKWYVVPHTVYFSFQASSTGASVVNTAGRNAIVTSLMVCCGFVACWSLNAISFFLNFAGYAIDFAGWFYHFTVVLVFTNSCINPFIYAGKYHEFQQGVRHLISKLKLHQQQSESATFV